MALFRRKTSSSPAAGPLCSCGTPLDLIDMDYGFELPDLVWEMPEEERRERLGGLSRVFVLDGSRGFVRTMLPVGLDHGSVTFGIWLEIPAAEAEHAMAVWEGPGYADLRLHGTVANYLAPWGDDLLGAAASARPESGNALPYVYEGDPVVRSMLEQVWPRDLVTAALPKLAHNHG